MNEQSQTSPEVNYFPTIDPVPGQEGVIAIKNEAGRIVVTVRFAQQVSVVIVRETRTPAESQWSRRALADHVSLAPSKPSMQLQTDRLIMEITDLCSSTIPAPGSDAKVSRADLIANLVKGSLRQNAPEIDAELRKKCLNVLVTNMGSMETVNVGAYASVDI